MVVAVLLAIAGAAVVSACLLRTPALRAVADGTAAIGRVTVIIPARDEAANLPGLLASLAAGTTSPAEVIVVDDGSTDGTAGIAAAHGASVIDPGPPPPGWLGKPWACAAGARAAAHERLVFLDADVRLAGGGLAAVVAAHGRIGGVLSVQPQHRPGRVVEELSAVFNVCAVAGAGGGLPGRAHVAFGPCLVVGRDVYEQIGGHAAVAGSVIEDVDLARCARAADVPVSGYRGGDLVAYRMYPQGWSALVDGWTKNIARGAGAAPRWAVLATVIWVAGLADVAIRASAGLVGWAGGGAVPWTALVAYAAVAAHTAWTLARVGRFRVVTAAAYPVPLAVFIGVFVRSFVAVALRRPVRWRDRHVLHDSSAIDEATRP
jgi:4,4'-diaponeurosporenoate glycosyltransferase